MNEFGEPWAIRDDWGGHQMRRHREVGDRLGRLVFVANGDPDCYNYDDDRRNAARVVACVNFLADVPDRVLVGRQPPDHVQLALAVLRNPDDLAPVAALVDACLERLGGGRRAAGEGARPACEHCGCKNDFFAAGVCCSRRVEETHWRD